MILAKETLFLGVKHVVLVSLLWFISTTGDTLLRDPNIQENIVARAFIDNVTHFIIGGISWTISVSCQPFASYFVWEILLCSLFSSFIDIDHFLMAKSYKIQDAISLQTRPPFHNTFLMLSVSFFYILAMNHLQLIWWKRLGFIFAVAIVSHHLRDSLRRGLYLWPLQSTKPINTLSFVSINYIFSLLCHFVLKDKQLPTDLNIV